MFGEFRVIDRMSRPLRRMARGIDRVGSTGIRTFRDLRGFANMFKTAMVAAGVAITAALAAIVAGMREVITTGMEFEQSITAAAAKFPGQIRRGTAAFEELEEAAKQIGATTEFTASQAAEGLNFLAMAGFNADQAISALPGVVDLATAAQLELGRASDIATDSLGAFGLATEDATQLQANLTRINDVLARTSTTANTTVEEMFEAIRTGASTATSAGASVETFSALLGELANSGVKGAEAGTALRNVFLRLQAPERAAQRHLRQLGVRTKDAEGNFRDVNSILGELSASLDGMGTADRSAILKDIFGLRAVNAANILLRSGQERLDEYRGTLEGASGAAGEMAATMRDTTQGDLNSMNSAIEALKIELFEVVRGPLRDIIAGITEWFRANREWLTSGFQEGVTWLVDNMPEIVKWTKRAAIAFGILAGIIIISGALIIAPFLILWALIVGVLAAWDALTAFIEESGVGEAISDAFDTAWNFVRDTLTTAWENIRETFTAIAEFVTGVWVIIRERAMAELQPVFDLFNMAADFVMEAWAPVGAFLGEIWDAVAAKVGVVWTKISDKVTGVWDAIKSKASQLVGEIQAAFKPLREFFAELWEGISGTFTEIFGGVVGGIGRAIDQVRGLGRQELGDDSDQAGGGVTSQMVSPQERVARTISETTNTTRGEVTIRDESGRAEVTRQSGGPIRLQVADSGAL